MAAKGRAVYSEDAIKRRMMKGNPGMGANGPRDGQQQLSPSNSSSAGPMIKGTPKVGGMGGGNKKGLGNTIARRQSRKPFVSR